MIDRWLFAPESLKCDVFNAISDKKYRWRDISHAEEVLGFHPSGHANDYDVDDPGGWHQVLDGNQKLRCEIGHRPIYHPAQERRYETQAQEPRSQPWYNLAAEYDALIRTYWA